MCWWPIKTMAETLKAVLDRPKSLGIRPIQHDGRAAYSAGCRVLPRRQSALASVPRPGIARQSSSSTSMAVAERTRLESKSRGMSSRNSRANGWAGDRTKAVVIEPELEAWVWTGSPHAARVLGWQRGYDDLKGWLVARRLWLEGDAKPSDPKAAMKAVLRETRKAHSAALFGELAKRTTWRGCQCPAFAELKSTLKRWFGDAQGTAPARTP